MIRDLLFGFNKKMFKVTFKFFIGVPFVICTSLVTFSAVAGSPYNGSPVSLSSGIVQAENFDKGGSWSAYYDSTTENIGGQYRPDEDVDIEHNGVGGYNIGWLGMGEWLEYSVRVDEAGDYDVAARIASPSGQGRFAYEFVGASAASAEIGSFPQTGEWKNWVNSAPVRVSLAEGDYRSCR